MNRSMSVSGFRRIPSTALLVAMAVACAAAQTQDFAVASVKPSQIGNSGREGSERENITISPTGVIMKNISLRSCIRWAYDMRDYQISGPDWLASQRYDIAAKSEGTVSAGQLRPMMQRLLSDRFELKVRRESKDLPVYAMVIAKKGSKLQPADGGESSMAPVGGALVFRNYSMPELAERLATRPFTLDRVVLDQTGLGGVFNFSLRFADSEADLKHTMETMDQGDDRNSVWLMALEKQLGLSFKALKSPVESLVVEHAEKAPTQN
jgi:uncharacterized protein (TIGR03435 family)